MLAAARSGLCRRVLAWAGAFTRSAIARRDVLYVTAIRIKMESRSRVQIFDEVSLSADVLGSGINPYIPFSAIGK